ncbi:UPF0548 protein At2g17695 isoform X2 [Nymphaea colorata]|uniref:UPF0548 protein At2g17695 isoform X2 n=1 Tax=Nymphaea colorata TaxID=210225 RepID=UPI00129E12C6|nr:UPF0548 protein At2g17695 isoform X2 [Nymphaea colorata]
MREGERSGSRSVSHKMVFLFWNRPSPHQQSACLKQAGDFNYDSKYRCLTSSPSDCNPNSASSSPPLPSSSLSELRHGSNRDGFVVNRARVLLGSGLQTYQQGKRALQAWKHFGLDWAFVDPSSPVEVGERFCVCVKELVPWAVLPLQIVYVNDHDAVKDGSLKRGLTASFAFGSGTLRGHLLAGEERFSVELDEDNKVWYEIFSISKPAHLLSFVGYPYVRFRQKYFAQQSMDALVRHVHSQERA